MTSTPHKNEDINMDSFEYDTNTLMFLRKKLDIFTIDLFRMIIKENRIHKGLLKTRLEDYHKLRKKYDSSFLILEYQGFIEQKKDGTASPYFVTVRGRQLVTLLSEEKMNREEHIND